MGGDWPRLAWTFAGGPDDPTLAIVLAAKQRHEQVLFASRYRRWRATNAWAKQGQEWPNTELPMPCATDICSSNPVGLRDPLRHAYAYAYAYAGFLFYT